MTLRSSFLALLLLMLALGSRAQSPTDVTDGELAVLPAYCMDTLGFRDRPRPGNSQPRHAYWESVMGKGFTAMHHYCWARINIRRITTQVTDKARKAGLMTGVLGDLGYVIKNSTPDFVMLPEIYTTMAEAELIRENPAGAFANIDTATKLKPSYARSYMVWGNYLASVGKTKEGRDFVKVGVQYNPSLVPIRELYKRLGGDLAAIVPTAPPTAPAQAAAPASPASAEPPGSASAAAASAPQ